MSSPDYVTQNEYPLDDDTTLMSTTDLHSYMTHTNDTFVQVSGFTLQELLGQPHNIYRVFSRHVVHAAKGRTLERDCQKPT